MGGRHQAGVGPRPRPRGSARPRRRSGPAAFGRSTSYTLEYDYSGSPQTLAWKQTSGDLTSKLDGKYRFERAGDGNTEVTYTLEVELRVPLPGFIKRRAQSRIMHTALEEFEGARRVLAHDVTPAGRERAGDEVGSRGTVSVAGEVTIGIDVGGTKLLGIALDDSGKVLADVRAPTPDRHRLGEAGRSGAGVLRRRGRCRRRAAAHRAGALGPLRRVRCPTSPASGSACPVSSMTPVSSGSRPTSSW